MDLVILLDDQLAAAPVGNANAHTGILHGTGNALDLGIVIVFLNCQQSLNQTGGFVHDLTVGQHSAGTDGIAEADLPRGDPYQIRCHIQQGLNGKAGLSHAEATEGTGGLVMCKLTGGKVNPLIGSAGVSAVPMAARVSNMVGQKNNPSNFLLMHAMGPNVAGVIGSAIAAGFLLSVFG